MFFNKVIDLPAKLAKKRKRKEKPLFKRLTGITVLLGVRNIRGLIVKPNVQITDVLIKHQKKYSIQRAVVD